MADPTPPHSGIELDSLDMSRLAGNEPFNDPADRFSGKIDYKTFVKAIFKKILNNASFLSFSNQIQDVNKILLMKYSSANDIAEVILKDVALTSKLLKLVNSSFYGQFSPQGISTISEAMIILGTEEVKQAAASLKIYELMQDISDKKLLKDRALKAMQRSIVARQIALDSGVSGAESVQISAMLYDFGEYLVALFSPEVFIDIEIQMEEGRLDREQASRSVIGISYNELGRFVVSKWNLPAPIINAMKPVQNFQRMKNTLKPEEIQQHICSFANELCGIQFSEAGESIGKEIIRISGKYQKSLDIEASEALKLLKLSWDRITRHASILKQGGEKDRK